jgi:hypothetical protein
MLELPLDDGDALGNVRQRGVVECQAIRQNKPPMPRFVDLIGSRFGRLIVIRRRANRGDRVVFLCRCDCGEPVERRANCHWVTRKEQSNNRRDNHARRRENDVFPSIGAMNPALTPMANALRVGDHLLTRPA